MDKLVRVEVGDKKEMSREIMFLVLLLVFFSTLYDELHQIYRENLSLFTSMITIDDCSLPYFVMQCSLHLLN